MKLLILLAAFVATYFVDLEKRFLFNNQLEILVPKEFKEMSKEHIESRYPGKNRPKLILTDEAEITNLAFTLIDQPADSTNIDLYKDAIVASYKKNPQLAKWISDGVMKINGKRVGFMQILTNAGDQKIYNHLFFTDVNGKLLIGTFNCLEKDMNTWGTLSEDMVQSLKSK